MKILHLLSQRPDSTGSGIYIQAILRESRANNHTNFIIAGLNGNNLPTENIFDDTLSRFLRFQTKKFPFAIPGMSDVMPYPSSKFQDLSATQLNMYKEAFTACLTDVIPEYKPDIIHSHHLWLLSSLVKTHFPEIPLITNCHGSDLRQFQLCSHLRNEVSYGCRQIDTVLALTGHQRQQIHSLYAIPADKIQVVGAGIDTRSFYFQNKRKDSVPTIVYAGKLSRAKGVPWLLRAMLRLKTPRWHLHLVGSGTGRDLQECLEEAQPLHPNITIHGNVDQITLANILRRSHLFILPSFYEGLPLVVLEALACGCRVIATELPGCKELCKKCHDNLISLIKLPRLKHVDTPFQEDEEQFIEDIKYAVDEGLSKTSPPTAAEIKEATERYSWSKVFNKIENIYHQYL